MLKGKEFGAAIGRAIQMKLDSGAARSKAEIARHFRMQPPSLVDWVKKGSIEKDKLPEVWRYFSDVAGPEHWGMTAAEWPAGLTLQVNESSLELIADPDPRASIRMTDEEKTLLEAFRSLDSTERTYLLEDARKYQAKKEKK